MVVHSVGIAMGVSSALAVGKVVVRTTNELPSALAQHEKNVVIENEELNRKFSRLAYWQEARWWFVAFLVYKLLASSIANDYKLEHDWHLKWKAIDFSGKTTLTPRNK